MSRSWRALVLGALAGLVACASTSTSTSTPTASSTPASTSTSTGTSTTTQTPTPTASSPSTSTRTSATGSSSSGSSSASTSATSGSGGSSGGSSSLAFDGGYCDGHWGGPTLEYGYCSADSDCACPFACNPNDPPFSLSGGPGSVCEFPCATSADCPEAKTACQGGYCAYDLCDVSKTIDGSAPNGTASGLCDASDAGDGSCVVLDDPLLGVLAVCLQGGSATGTCDGAAGRADPGGLCVAGEVCVAGPDGGACRMGCDPQDGGLCPGGQGCGAIDPSGTFLDFGACFATNGACLAGFPFDNEMAGCGVHAGCGCLGAIDIECYPDSAIGTALNPWGEDYYCERLCAGTADCAVPSTACRGGWCSYDFCGRMPSGADAGSGYDLPCDAAATADGTCLPVATHTADPAYGLCLQGGTATAACAPAADRKSPAGLCGAGSYCVPLPDGGDGCLAACNPTLHGAQSCPAGTSCTGVVAGASVAFGTCE